MDPDYLERRRAQELEWAERAACEASRAAHRSLAVLYTAVMEGRLTLPGRFDEWRAAS